MGHGLRPDRDHARPLGGAGYRGRHHRPRRGERDPTRRRHRCAVSDLAQGRRHPPCRLRFHRRLRRLPRSQPQDDSGERPADLREGLSLRLAGRAVTHASGHSRSDLQPSRTRIRALQHALEDPEPVLRPVPGSTTTSRNGPTIGSGRSSGAVCPRKSPGRWRPARRSRRASRRSEASWSSRCATGASSLPATPRTSCRRPGRRG